MRAGANTISIWALPLAILAAACLLIVADPGGIASRIRGLEFDAYQHAKPRPFEDTGEKTGHPVKILDADAASVARFGPWPWRRTVLAKLLGELKTAGASVVVLDMPLDTPDPSVTLAQSLPDTPQTAALRTELAKLPSPDEAFATALTSIPTVTSFTLGEDGRAPARKRNLFSPVPRNRRRPFPDLRRLRVRCRILKTQAPASARAICRSHATAKREAFRLSFA